MASVHFLSRVLTLTGIAAALNVTLTAAVTQTHVAVDEEALLDRESQAEAADLGADDTSLLQTSFRMPEKHNNNNNININMGKDPPSQAVNLRIQPSIMNPDGVAYYDLPPETGDQVDVPEAGDAWALFQQVPPGPVQLPLANDTELEPPGAGRYTAQDLKAAGIGVNKPSYKGTSGKHMELAPDWFWNCLGKDWHTTNISGQSLFAAAVPQIVPFIVPIDHPNRTDVSVLIAPGGGGTFVAWEAEGTDVAKWFNLLGISAFVVKYRVPAPDLWPQAAAVMDAQRAVSMVRRLAPQLGLNSSRVGLFGASHGGWVALMTAFSARRQYDARDSVDQHSPVPDFLVLLYPGVDTELNARATSPFPVGTTTGGLALTDLRNPVPIFIASGANDRCVIPQSLYFFHSMLKLRGNPTVEMNIYANIGHGFSSCFRMEDGGFAAMKHESCVWMVRARRFIMWHVEHKTPPDIATWYRKMQKFETSLLVTNTSGALPRHGHGQD